MTKDLRWRYKPQGMVWKEFYDASNKSPEISKLIDLLLGDFSDSSNRFIQVKDVQRLIVKVSKDLLLNPSAVSDNPPLEKFRTVLRSFEPQLTTRNLSGKWYKYIKPVLEEILVERDRVGNESILPRGLIPSRVDFEVYLLPFPSMEPYRSDPKKFENFVSQILVSFSDILDRTNGFYHFELEYFISSVSNRKLLFQDDIPPIAEGLYSSLPLQTNRKIFWAIARLLKSLLDLHMGETAAAYYARKIAENWKEGHQEELMEWRRENFRENISKMLPPQTREEELGTAQWKQKIINTFSRSYRGRCGEEWNSRGDKLWDGSQIPEDWDRSWDEHQDSGWDTSDWA